MEVRHLNQWLSSHSNKPVRHYITDRLVKGNAKVSYTRAGISVPLVAKPCAAVRRKIAIPHTVWLGESPVEQ
jgi:hypothetical protein